MYIPAGRFKATNRMSPMIPVVVSGVPNGDPAVTEFPPESNRNKLGSKPPVAYDVEVMMRLLREGSVNASSRAVSWLGSVPVIVAGNIPV